ncbi:MAG: GLUG motif-containing protein [Halovenus sp.]
MPALTRRQVLRKTAVGLVGTAGVASGRARGQSSAPDPDEYTDILARMDGQGTDDNPYVVTDLDGLQAVAGDVGARYELGADIDASTTAGWNDGRGFDPILPFVGRFDGASHVIRSVTIDRALARDVGLFGTVERGEVTDLTVVDADVTGDRFVGGLVGRVDSESRIRGATVEGTVRGQNRVGGLVGLDDGGTVSDASADVDIDGGRRVGGVVGSLGAGGVVEDSSADGTVVGENRIGGLVGSNVDGTVRASTASVSVDGQERVGGLVGANVHGPARNFDVESTEPLAVPDATGNTENQRPLDGSDEGEGVVVTSSAIGSVRGERRVGGLVGTNAEGLVVASDAGGRIDGERRVGGLVGNNTGELWGTRAVSDVVGVESVGGLVGANTGTADLAVSYALGSVSGERRVGGLVGVDDGGTVSESFAAGVVSGDADTGGLVGRSGSGGEIRHAYWDVPASGLTGSDGGVGLGSPGSDPPAEQMTGSDATEHMEGFDFANRWRSVEDPASYPALRLDDETDSGADAVGPGFGVGAIVAALGGAAYVLKRRVE